MFPVTSARAYAKRLRVDGFLAVSMAVIAATSKNLSLHDLQRVCCNCFTDRPPDNWHSSTTSAKALRPQMGHGNEANRIGRWVRTLGSDTLKR
jgi:hypothetical protein